MAEKLLKAANDDVRGNEVGTEVHIMAGKLLKADRDEGKVSGNCERTTF